MVARKILDLVLQSFRLIDVDIQIEQLQGVQEIEFVNRYHHFPSVCIIVCRVGSLIVELSASVRSSLRLPPTIAGVFVSCIV